MITVDGSMMEGGGQLLRMATAYSAINCTPVKVENIRAGRSDPGLKPQHLATLRAAAEMCGARLTGDRPGSGEITFIPGAIRGGDYVFDIGTAGSVTLLLQCLAPIAAYAESPVRLVVTGGTAVKWSPPTPFLENVVWRAFNHMGFDLRLTVKRHGFYPKGGGEVVALINPVGPPRPLITAPSPTRVIRGLSLCGKLPAHVAVRQGKAAQDALKKAGYKPRIDVVALEGRDTPLSPGSLMCLWSEAAYLGSCTLGERGKPAEAVGAEAAKSLIGYMKNGAHVDPHTADNLILPLSLAGGESTFTTSEVTLHTLTAIRLAETFTGSRFSVEGGEGGPTTVKCLAREAGS
jgi:RNA 3'-terminal phosphate cyclase (ATP)